MKRRWQARGTPNAHRGIATIQTLAWLTFAATLANAVLQLIPLMRPAINVLANPSLVWSLETLELPRCSEPRFASLLRFEVAAAFNTPTFLNCQWGIAVPVRNPRSLCAAWISGRGHRPVYYASGSQIQVIPDSGLEPWPKGQQGHTLSWQPSEAEIVMMCDTVPRGSRIFGKLWFCDALTPRDIDCQAWSETTATWDIVEARTDTRSDVGILRNLLDALFLSVLCFFLGGGVVFRAMGTGGFTGAAWRGRASDSDEGATPSASGGGAGFPPAATDTGEGPLV